MLYFKNSIVFASFKEDMWLIYTFSVLKLYRFRFKKITLTKYILKILLPSSMKKLIPRISVRQSFKSLTKFIEKSDNIYNIKYTSYKNIFYDKSNDTNLIL